MKRRLNFVSGLGLGAGLTYLFDPDAGHRRRALARDKVVHLINKTSDAIDATSRDLQHRMFGLVARTRSRLVREKVTDEVLAARVRSKIGMLVSYPHTIEVRVQDGCVTLTGPVFKDEVDRLLSTVSKIRGVTGIENKLEIQKEEEGAPGRKRKAARLDFMQENWSPTTRLMMGTAGALVSYYGMKRQGLFRAAAGTVGLAMMARALTNMPMKRLVGIGAGYRAVDIKKTINIAAPVEKVFAFWENVENLPKFMRNVRQIQRKGDDLSHWVVAGPAGIPVEWDAVRTQRFPNKILAWKTLPGSIVDHAGIIHFDPNPDGSTRVDIHMSYNPPAGAIGHIAATLFGADPKKELDEDIVRMKTFIEKGILPRDAAAA